MKGRNPSMADTASSTRAHHAGDHLQALEPRTYWSASPASATPALTAAPAMHSAPKAHALETGLTNADRQFVIDKWQRGTVQKHLQSVLNADVAAGDNGVQFDAMLLAYMTAQFNGNSHYFFQSADIEPDIQVIQDPTNALHQPFRNNWKKVMVAARAEYNHVFGSYTEPANIDWFTNPAQFGADDTFIHKLNNMGQFTDFAQAYRLHNIESDYADAGDPKFVAEIQKELISWTKQNPPLANPDDYHHTSPKWWLLDTTGRVRNWMQTYSLLIGTPAFNGALNTLFIKEFYINGDFMARVTPKVATSNTVAAHAAALSELATVFPMFAASKGWYTHAVNDLITPVLQSAFFSDGGQIEQSPGYAKVVLTVIGEAYYLNHSGWPANTKEILSKAADAYYQVLEPDGTEPGIGDTVRAISSDVTGPLKLELGKTSWSPAKLRMDAIFMFGANAAVDSLNDSPNPAPINRGLTAALTGSGTYVMRSGETADATQLILNAGATASVGSAHGHYDLFNFDLYGDGKPLIADPGVHTYVANAERDRLISTPAHNTISINGKNHQFVSPADASKYITVEQFDAPGDHVQVTARHIAYQGVSGVNGNPVLTRSIWYDTSDTYMVVDFANATSSNTYNVAYNLVGKTAAGANGSIHTTNASGENVMVVPVLLAGQTTHSAGTTVFTGSNLAATYFTVSQKTASTIFASIVVTYQGTTPPNITARWKTLPTATTAGTLQVLENGVVTKTASFTQNFPPSGGRRRRAAVTSAIARPATTWSATPIGTTSMLTTQQQKDSLFSVSASSL